MRTRLDTSGRWASFELGRRAPRMLVALCVLLAGCASHSDKTLAARTALDQGAPQQALGLLNEEMDVENESQVPEDVGGDNSLLLLDRAMVLQQLASTAQKDPGKQYKWSSRDLQLADKQIEVLDLSRNALHDIGKYIFSDETGPYKAPTYEKLMVNTMNMVNYLARGDLGGAKVEARRLAVMQKYISEHEGLGASLSGPGSYLAGFAFEKSNDAQEALRYYDEALQYGRYPSLGAVVRRLSHSGTYRSPRITELLAGADASSEGPASDDSAELLVVLGFGRVPAKIAKRIPIGLALTFVSGWLAPNDIAKANYLAAQGLVTWINYPELGPARGQNGTPGFALDGTWQTLEGALAIDQEAKRAWEQAKGSVIASAITRLITRVLAGEALRHSTSNDTLGALLSLGTQATLTAMDTPDTRSWATLPARIAIGRVRVAPGKHYIDLDAGGIRRRKVVTLEPGGWALLNMTVLR